jgi:hypothetical protein
MSEKRPSVTALVPTFNNAGSLAAALESLGAQRYDGEVELLCVDGGSTDATREIAERLGARIVDNPLRNEEEARALEAIGLADDVVSADALFHEWRGTDPPVTRLCALMGGTDPLAIDLGWADRWAHHLGRWTGADVVVERVPSGRPGGDVLIIRLDPDRPPPMGSNGFLVRRDALLQTEYRPFVHSDVVGDLAERGWRFARVPEGIVHHYAPTLRLYAKKARRRAARTVKGEPAQRRGLSVPRRKVLARAIYAITLVGPILAAIRGYRAHPDRAWALLPALYVITTLAYAEATLRSALGR